MLGRKTRVQRNTSQDLRYDKRGKGHETTGRTLSREVAMGVPWRESYERNFEGCWIARAFKTGLAKGRRASHDLKMNTFTLLAKSNENRVGRV